MAVRPSRFPAAARARRGQARMLIDRAAVRWTLPVAAVVLAWAGSMYTPWAADTASRLWLYDLVYYLRYVALLAWLAVAVRLAATGASRRQALPLALAALVAAVVVLVESPGLGLRLRVAASADALDRVAAGPDGLYRRRAGHLIIDGVSRPCDRARPWLWLGRPHGGGTGTGIALVRSPAARPQVPRGGAHRVLHLDGPGWLAFQHGAPTPQLACESAVELRDIAAGRAFMARGR
ncbi:hypothetical protein [Cognatilysobacter segetis]|uniref:hypothetical protein n=1 Tax=Cognatilysobacter segetis TaxID=2492394 RepID=UPI0013904985|nr:hypothetical protein [Lysobacter segetis]